MKRLLLTCILVALTAGAAVAQEPQRWEYARLLADDADWPHYYEWLGPDKYIYNSGIATEFHWEFVLTFGSGAPENPVQEESGDIPNRVYWLMLAGHEGWELVSVLQECPTFKRACRTQ